MKIKDLVNESELDEVHQGEFVSTLSKGFKDIKNLYSKNSTPAKVRSQPQPKAGPLDNVDVKELKLLLKSIIEKRELDNNQLRFVQDLYRKI